MMVVGLKPKWLSPTDVLKHSFSQCIKPFWLKMNGTQKYLVMKLKMVSLRVKHGWIQAETDILDASDFYILIAKNSHEDEGGWFETKMDVTNRCSRTFSFSLNQTNLVDNK